MQFSECVRRLCGYHFEIISTQSSSLHLLPALTCFLMNMLLSTSPGVVIQGKTSPILSGMVALRLHSFICLYAVLCVCQSFVWLAIWHHIHPIFHSFSTSSMNMFPHHWGLLYKVKHLEFFLGWLPLRLHSFFCLYAVPCVCPRFVWLSFWDHIHPIFHTLSTSRVNMFPHRWGLLHRERHLQFFLGCFPLRLHFFCYLYAILCLCQWFVWLSF